MKARFAFLSAFVVGACGAAASQPTAPDLNEGSGADQPVPEVAAPSARGLPPGDCRALPSSAPPTVLFTPFVPDTSSYPTPNSFALIGDRIYAALVAPPDGPVVGPTSIYEVQVSGGGTPFIQLDTKTINFRGGPLIGAQHVYWLQQHGSEWSNPPSLLAYRGGEVANASVGDMDTFLIDGNEAFVMTCASDSPSELPCTAFALGATRIDTGATEWSENVALTDAMPRTPLLVDGSWVYWAAPSATSPNLVGRVMRARRAGGAPTEFAHVALDEAIGGLLLDNGVVDVVILTATAGSDWKLALAPLGADGTVGARIPLGTTSSQENQVVLDDSSIYFTLDGDAAYPDQPRALQRVCRDGSNAVTLVAGFAYGTKTRTSVAEFAVDGAHVYFTSANQVLSIAK